MNDEREASGEASEPTPAPSQPASADDLTHRLAELLRANRELESQLAAAREAQGYAEAVVACIPDPLLVLDADLCVLSANEAFYETFQAAPETTVGRPVFELGDGQWNLAGLRARLEALLVTGAGFASFEVAHEAAAIGRRDLLLNGRRLTNPLLVLLTLTEITARKAAAAALRADEARQAFLVQLGDAIRPLSDAVEITQTVARLAMDHFKADRCYYAEIEGDAVTIRRDARRAGLPPIANVYSLSETPLFKSVSQSGQPIVVQDVNASGVVDDSLKQLCLSVNIRSYINVPVIKDKRLVGNFCLTQSAPRSWAEVEVNLAVETAERTWAAVERARAEEALRASEQKYRAMFEAIGEGVSILEVLFDEGHRATDYRFIENNPAVERMTGVGDSTGKTVLDLFPNFDRGLIEIAGEVARSGRPARFQHFVPGLDRWFDVHEARVGGEDSRTVIAAFADITERKRREAALAILNEVSRDLERLTNIDGTMAALGRKIGAHFKVSRVNFAAINEAAGEAVITHEWHAEGLAAIASHRVYRLGDFISNEFFGATRAGEMMIVHDTREDARTTDAAYAPLDTRAFVTTPFVKNGQWLSLMSISASEPRDWRDDEIELMREITARIWSRLERARAEEALRESEERLRLIIEGAQGYAIFTIDADGTVDSWNGGAAAIFGWSETDIIGRNADVLFTPEDRAAREPQKELATAAAEGVAPDIRWHQRKDRSRVFINGVVQCLFDAAGRPSGFVKIGRDLTVQHEAEEALRESEEQFRRAIEEAPLPVIMHAEDGEVLQISRSWSELTGYALEDRDVIQTWLTQAYGFGGEGVRDAMAQSFAPQEGKPMRAVVFDITTRQGEHRTWSFSASTPGTLRDGRRFVVGMAEDITERKRAEERLRDSEARFRATFEQANVGIVQATIEGKILVPNPGFCKIIGYTAEEARQLAVRDITHPDDYEGDMALAARVTAGEIGGYSIEKRYIRKDGKTVWVQMTSTLVRHASGEPYYALAIIEDISERKAAAVALHHLNETLEARVRERTRQVHELAAALTMAEQEERRRVSQVLHDDLQQLLYSQLIRLQMARSRVAEADHATLAAPLDRAMVEVRQAVQVTRTLVTELNPPILQSEGLPSALEWLADHMRQRYGMTVAVMLDGSCEPRSREVRLLLIQMTRELLFNVVKHAGTLEATLRLERAGDELRLQVEDHGLGFDVEATRGPASPPSGYGLHSIGERLRLVGGRIEIESVPGDGSRISLIAPCRPASESQPNEL